MSSKIKATSEIDVFEDSDIGGIVRALTKAGIDEVRVGSYGAAAGESLGIKFVFWLDELEAVKAALAPWDYKVSAVEECAVPGDTSTNVEVIW